MNKVFVGVVGLLLIGAALFLRGSALESQSKRIGVVVPIEHQAMDDMLSGFKERVLGAGDIDVIVEVQNAQGDLNIQRAMIEKFARQNVDLIATIGTDVSLMAMSCVPDRPVLGMDITGQVHQGLASTITGVKESPIEPSYLFIRELLPAVKKVAMIYSASDKNYQMIKDFSALATQDSLEVQGIMVQSMAELYILAKTIDADVGAIFIGKDHLVASGAPILSQVADELGVPFITSDEGSVIAGGTMALGNKEKDIGRTAGDIALKLLAGEKPNDIAIEPVSEMTLFVDPVRCQRRGIDINLLHQIAIKFNYSVELVRGSSVS